MDLLVLADNYGCEAALGRYVLNAFEANRKASIKQCRELFSLDKIKMPVITSQQHSLNSYDCLVGGLHG
ncbi:MAG: hypothetical protein QM504_04300 [Pseudomonadota bacterium]